MPFPLTEHQRLVLLAQEYQRRGYHTTLYPAKQVLPEPLQDFFIGLIAQADQALIVADVRTRENLTLAGAFDLHQIARSVDALPNATFELVVIANEVRSPPPFTHSRQEYSP